MVKTRKPISDDINDYIGYNTPCKPKKQRKTKQIVKKTRKQVTQSKGKLVDTSSKSKSKS